MNGELNGRGETLWVCVSYCGLTAVQRKLWLTSVPTSTSGYTEHLKPGSRPQCVLNASQVFPSWPIKNFSTLKRPNLCHVKCCWGRFEEAAVEVTRKWTGTCLHGYLNGLDQRFFKVRITTQNGQQLHFLWVSTRVYVVFNKPGSQGETLFTQFDSQVGNSWEALVSLVHAANPNHSVTQCAGLN